MMGDSTCNTFINNTNGQPASEDILKNFVKNEDEGLKIKEFKELCLELFGPEEVERQENVVEEMFKIFDFDGDEIIKGDEWRICFDDWIKVVTNPINVFVIVDVQNDFIEGSLAVENGDQIIEPINQLIKNCPWHQVIYTLDWHPENHLSFFENLHLRELHPDSKVKKEDAKEFDTVIFEKPRREQKLWPTHCISNTWGSQLHKSLFIASNSIQVRKGQDSEVDSYSAFFDNASTNSTELHTILEEMGATNLYMCGLAFDICVYSSCLDALQLGYSVALIDNCCGVISVDTVDEVCRKVASFGGVVMQAEQVKDYVSNKKRSIIMALKLAKKVVKQGNK